MARMLTGSSALVCSVLLFSAITVARGYPYATKRYPPQRAWAPMPIVYQPRATRPYAAYYDPYGQDISEVVDFYVPQDPYEKYRLYQVPPYYYPEQYYYDEEEEQEDEDVPYNQENWYNNGNAEANAMFLKNLIMAQMYKDASNKGMRYPTPVPKDDYDDGYVYGEPVRESSVALREPIAKEDEDVRELKSLIGGKERRLGGENRRSKMENRWVDKRADMTTPSPEVSTKLDKGQDEVVMFRPAPARAQILHQRSYQPSVYDTIKKLLIEQKNNDKRHPKKRSYVMDEDALVQELGKLKKTQ